MQPDVAETALLGACLLNRKAPLIAGDFVVPSDFFTPKHQIIFGAMVDIVTRGEEVDPVTVVAELGSRLPDVGGSPYIFSLPQLCPAATNVRQYAQAVRAASLDRSLRSAVSDAVESLEGEDLLLALQDKLYRLDRRVERSVNMAQVWERMRASAEKPTAPGCSYPWWKIQSLTRGMRPGWLCVLAGEASHGKTAAALETARHALKDGKKVVLVSQEMGDTEVGVRLAQRQGFNSDHYYEGDITPADLSVLAEVSQEEYWANFQLERVERVAQIPLLLRRWKPDLLIIDHLQLLAGAEKVETLSANTRQLKLMAERFNTPILCLSQLSRGEYQERGKLPRLSRLRGSGTIEQDADTVLFVWRKRDENEQLTPESALYVAKSRMGRVGAVRTRFNGETQEFVPVIAVAVQPFYNESSDDLPF